MNTNMKYAAECLDIALNALAFREAYGLEVRMAEDGDMLLVVDKSGSEVAAVEWRADVILVPTLTGHRVGTGWCVYLAEWDDGDPSVGMAGSWELDLDCFDSTHKYASDAAMEVAQFLLRMEVDQACKDANEYMYWQDTKEMEEV